MIKPETAFINSIHKKLKLAKPSILIRKTSDRFNQGWPDVLYIGPFRKTLWVEYKIYPNKLSKMQEHTIYQLTNYDQHIAVITKHPNEITLTDYLVHPTYSIELTDPAKWIMFELGYE